MPTVAEEQFVYAAQDHTHLGTYAGERRLWLPDSSANYASCPDAAALDITGDIDMRFWGAANDWLPGTTFYLLAKIDSLGGNWAYQFRVRGADGQLQATFSPDGTGGSAVVATCNGEASTVDGEEIALRVTWRVSDGRTQFFESLDDGKTWTQVGSDVTAAAGSIFSGSAPLQVGATNDGSAGLFAGVVKRAEVYDGIDGTLVAALDCNVPTHPRFRDGVGNSWTFNGSAYSWAEPA